MTNTLKTKWFSLPAAGACFEIPEIQLGRSWEATNDDQNFFLSQLYPKWKESLKELVRPSELETKLEVKPFGLGLLSKIITCSRWATIGTEVNEFPESCSDFLEAIDVVKAFDQSDPLAFNPNKDHHGLVCFDTFNVRFFENVPNPVFSMRTKDDKFKEEVHITPYVPGLFKEGDGPFSLWNMVSSLKPDYSKYQSFDRLYFPKINLDLEEGLGWPLGCTLLPEADEPTQIVVVAKQRLKLQLNHEGFYEKNEFEMLTLACASEEEEMKTVKYYVLNGPMVYWRTRNDAPCFVAIIANENYGDPGDIEFND